uniref:Ring finger protein 11 n=1 Tax=Salvator merianae TaxID=96440 RepID=A0A8D0DYK2_SALMN
MGNCLKSPTSDDISLLHESQSDRASYGDGTEPDQEPPPPYQEQVPVPVYHPTPSQTRLATQLTEEEQIRIAQRIGLIQHLPKGVYDPGRDGSEKKIRESCSTLVFSLEDQQAMQEYLRTSVTAGTVIQPPKPVSLFKYMVEHLIYTKLASVSLFTSKKVNIL